jgi:hypothetical protein
MLLEIKLSKGGFEIALTGLKARCHYQSFPSKTLSKKTWTKVSVVKELEGNLVNTKKWLQLSQIMKTLLSLYF